MKNARINHLSFGIALALTGVHAPMVSAADIELPEPPAVDVAAIAYYNASSESESKISPIEYGSTATGVLGDSNDYIGSDGVTRYDLFSFNITDPSTGYEVTLRSDSFAGYSTLWFYDSDTGDYIPEQRALVWEPGKQVQFSGSFPQAGTWVIQVESTNENLGSYTVGVAPKGSGTPVTSSCEEPSSQNPFVGIVPGEVVSCTLSADGPLSLTDETGERYYAKGFHFTGDGSAVTIRAESDTFSPRIYLYDPTSGQLQGGKSALSGPFSGDVLYVVTSTTPGATGAFNTVVDAGGATNGAFLQPAGQSYSIESVPSLEIAE